ncbi:ABC transporter ATP-binding protein [Peribacillus butanolivorans]|uniref:ABC transporter ATP-binding protein n=1 Tax=Peribacillus butanolivorans TaxID=421767 RepID=UPI0035D6DB71
MIIEINELKMGYGERIVLPSISIPFERGKIHSIVGPNGCGKSTLLKVIARQLKIGSGTVLLEQKEINQWGRKEFAKEIAFLMQSHDQTPEISVRALVTYGRFPHKKPMQRLDNIDHEIIERAIELTNLAPLANRSIMKLSGGERQRAWIAMALGQQPNVLLLDEPTTYLDIHHQLEVIELVKELNEDHGITIIMVLHDLNQAAMVSHQIVVLSKGELYDRGSPIEVIREKMLRDVFKVKASIQIDSSTGNPYLSRMNLIK